MKKNTIHPVKAVRLATGKSRPHFGKLIGVTVHTIKRLETGKLKLSASLAQRIWTATGALWPLLLEGKAQDESGRPYSPDSFKHWPAHQKAVESAHGGADRIKNLGQWVDLLLRSASSKGKLRTVETAMVEWLNSAREDFGLAGAIDSLQKETAKKQTVEMQVETLRNVPGYAQHYGFKDSKKLNDSDVVTVSAVEWRGWCPDGAHGITSD